MYLRTCVRMLWRDNTDAFAIFKLGVGAATAGGAAAADVATVCNQIGHSP